MKLVLVDVRDVRYYPKKISMPLGLCYLASFLRDQMKNIEIVIKEGYESSIDADADIVGISSVTTFYEMALKLAKTIKKERNIPVILGGIHVTALPYRLDPIFDVGVLGEGEETIVEVMDLYSRRKKFLPEDLKDIRGIAFHSNGEVIINPPRPYIKPLDNIPFPDRELLDLSDRTILLQTSRGCPYRCTFCALLDFNRVFRKFSPQYVVSEVERLFSGKYSIEVSVVDDLFCADIRRLSEIAEIIQKKELHKKVCFGVTMRADIASEKVMKILRSLNVLKVYIGLESGSDKVLSYLKKNTVTVQDNQKALDLCSQFGIKVDGSFIVGSPEEEVDDLKATYEFIYNNYKQGKFSTVRIAPLTPLPGSQVWEYAKARGLVDEDMDWSCLEMSLGRFDPDKFVYLNEKIPLPEFLRYLDIFEDMMYSINRNFIKFLGVEEQFLRLDRGKIQNFLVRHS